MISEKQTIQMIALKIYFANFSSAKKEVRLQIPEVEPDRYLKINTKPS